MTFGHRGWNRQPVGGLRKSGGVPPMSYSSFLGPIILGNALISACVYGWNGSLNNVRRFPYSTSFPAYIIANVSQTSAMTDRSCVIIIIDKSNSFCNFLVALRTCD